jgi:hypothetical protein
MLHQHLAFALLAGTLLIKALYTLETVVAIEDPITTVTESSKIESGLNIQSTA